MYSNKYDCIIGRWSKKRYTLIKKLGAGGIGEIYLVQADSGDMLALKLSTDLISITKEYNYLKKFQPQGFMPMVYELDDYTKGKESYHFFTMEYIEGYTLKSAMQNDLLSLKTKVELICLIAKILKKINDAGYVYTDLKSENIMIDRRNGLIKLIDMGSIVQIGSTVKEYTPMYDRAAWGKGKRIADVSYQLFVIVLLFLSMLMGRTLDPDKENLDGILSKLKKEKLPTKLYEVILRGIEGRIRDCDRLYAEMKSIKVKKRRVVSKVNNVLNAVIAVLALIFIGTVFALK